MNPASSIKILFAESLQEGCKWQPMTQDGYCNHHKYCHDPTDPSFEEEELEPGPSNGDGISPLECLKNPGTEEDAVPGPSGIGGGGQPDG